VVIDNLHDASHSPINPDEIQKLHSAHLDGFVVRPGEDAAVIIRAESDGNGAFLLLLHRLCFLLVHLRSPSQAAFALRRFGLSAADLSSVKPHPAHL
jgi:hypothetical protein